MDSPFQSPLRNSRRPCVYFQGGRTVAFMALFGWIFIPVILLALVVQAVTAPLLWAAAHPGTVNAITAGLLAGNLLLLFWLLRVRVRRKRSGKKGGWLLFFAALWEAWVAFLCVLFLAVQPLRFLPENFGTPLTEETVCFGEWGLVSCQGIPSGYTRTQEEISQYLGTRLTYAKDRFTSNGKTYPLDPESSYDERVIWREESLNIPGSVVSTSFERLGIKSRKLRRGLVNFQEDPEKRPIGWLFYILDQDTLMVYYDCIFFQAKRVEALEDPS